jgi:hypothetical protein
MRPARQPEGTAVTQTRTTVNPDAPAQPWLTTWLVIREPVGNPAAMHDLGLKLGAVTADPPRTQAVPGAPDGYASMSFTTTDQPGARPRHQAFVLAAGKWLNEQKAPYAWRTGDGSWHAVGGTAR